MDFIDDLIKNAKKQRNRFKKRFYKSSAKLMMHHWRAFWWFNKKANSKISKWIFKQIMRTG